jgi:hypothetical protein
LPCSRPRRAARPRACCRTAAGPAAGRLGDEPALPGVDELERRRHRRVAGGGLPRAAGQREQARQRAREQGRAGRSHPPLSRTPAAAAYPRRAIFLWQRDTAARCTQKIARSGLGAGAGATAGRARRARCR